MRSIDCHLCAEAEDLDGLLQVALLLEAALKELVHYHLLERLPAVLDILFHIFGKVNILILFDDGLIPRNDEVADQLTHLEAKVLVSDGEVLLSLKQELHLVVETDEAVLRMI